MKITSEQVKELLKEYGYELHNICNGVVFTAIRNDRMFCVSVDIRTNSFKFMQTFGLCMLTQGDCSPFTDRTHFKKMESMFAKYASKHIDDI